MIRTHGALNATAVFLGVLSYRGAPTVKVVIAGGSGLSDARSVEGCWPPATNRSS